MSSLGVVGRVAAPARRVFRRLWLEWLRILRREGLSLCPLRMLAMSIVVVTPRCQTMLLEGARAGAGCACNLTMDLGST